MAIKCTHWVRSFVNICFYLCLLVEFTYSYDVPYSIENYDALSQKLEIAIEEHNIYKRAANNGTSSSDNSTSGSMDSTAAPVTASTPIPTTAKMTKAPTKAPTTASTPSTTTTFPIDEVKDKVNHKYYQSQIFLFSTKNMLYQEVANMNTHTTLNDNHRVAITVGLPFDFKFYGHSIKNFTIATGGFLYMSPFLHKFLTATQYIAPLMANFDTRLGNDSKIMYKGLSDRFIVEWKNVFLQDQNHTNPFTFQTILHKNGSIVFAYKDIPLPIKSISTNNHPVKVGLSDAFYVDTKDGSVTRRTIYEYNKIAVDINTIRSNSAVMIDPLLTCNLAKDCQSCVSLTGQFTCKWCERVQRCSNGFDWYHQEWRNAKCKDLAHNSLQKCDQTTAVPHTSRVIVSTESYKASCAEGKAFNDKSCPVKSVVPIAGIIVIVVLLLALIGGIGGWVYYAYTHPQSASGMWLMEHRPSQMKSKLATMKFWKKDTGSGEKYRIETEA